MAHSEWVMRRAFDEGTTHSGGREQDTPRVGQGPGLQQTDSSYHPRPAGGHEGTPGVLWRGQLRGAVALGQGRPLAQCDRQEQSLGLRTNTFLSSLLPTTHHCSPLAEHSWQPEAPSTVTLPGHRMGRVESHLGE